MTGAVNLIKNKFNDGSVKFFYLVVITQKGAPTTKSVKDFEKRMKFAKNNKALNDGKGDGVKALWSPKAKTKNTMVLAPGYKISSIGFGGDELEAAIEEAKK